MVASASLIECARSEAILMFINQSDGIQVFMDDMDTAVIGLLIDLRQSCENWLRFKVGNDKFTL